MEDLKVTTLFLVDVAVGECGCDPLEEHGLGLTTLEETRSVHTRQECSAYAVREEEELIGYIVME